MKKITLFAMLVLTMSLAVFGQTKSAPKKEMTVKEYFLAIPAEYLKADAESRASWIESESAEDGYLSFNMPADEIPGGEELEEEGVVYGNVQVFKKTKGGAVIGFSVNMCAESKCVGQILLLDYNGGKWDDVTSDLAPMIDNDEIGQILKDAPAYEKPIKTGVEIPLSISFNGTDKLIQFTAGETENISDSGVVAKMFKWNGETFAEFQYEESPE